LRKPDGFICSLENAKEIMSSGNPLEAN